MEPPLDHPGAGKWARNANSGFSGDGVEQFNATQMQNRSSQPIEADICVIGAGSGGLSVAAGVAAFGRKVVLIEKGKMGGDCLNYGCVPSKALLAAARRAQEMRRAGAFGIAPVEPVIDYRAVRDHVRRTIAAIAPNDSMERFTGLGVRVIRGAARFVAPETVAAGEHLIKARRFVIATGSAPAVPSVPGLSDVPFFTNETIFDVDRKIDHLIIIGGGPIGLELGQAYLRLGSQVTVLEAAKALAHDDPELTAVVIKRLSEEGMVIHEGARIERVERAGRGVEVHVDRGGHKTVIAGTDILVATGRKPTIDDLNLEAAGIVFDGKGVKVDAGLTTSNRKVFAIGDVTGGPQFTHVANYHAGIVIRRALFRLPSKVRNELVPWVTFTDPELAYIGLSEEQAREAGHKVSVLRWPYCENDRAQADRLVDGHVKVVADKKGRILGAGIVGDHAGELIQPWCLAMSRGLTIRSIATLVWSYPTLSEVNKRAAYRYYAAAADNPLIRKAVDLLARLG